MSVDRIAAPGQAGVLGPEKARPLIEIGRSLLIGVVLLLLRVAIPPNRAEQRPHAGADGSASSRISTYSASNRAKGGTANAPPYIPGGGGAEACGIGGGTVGSKPVCCDAH
jgi:hypothetical protein